MGWVRFIPVGLSRASAARGAPGRFRCGRFACVLLAICASVIALSSCRQHLPAMRQDNAALVMSMRSRPIEAVNQGRTELTLHDCIAITLANNLDIQTAIWNEQVKNDLAKGSKFRLLPRLHGTHFFDQRDRQVFSRSDINNNQGANSINQGTGVTNYSSGRERFTRSHQIQAEWSPMDAAIAWYLYRIKDNEANYARYQRVRVAQQLIGSVTAAFHRLNALTRAHPKARALVGHRAETAQDLEKLMSGALVEAQQYLNAKGQLTEAKYRVSEIQLNIEKQKELLAVAMNVTPCSITLIGGALPPPVCPNPCDLEAAALVNRPEAYQADITFLNSINDRNRLWMNFFPKAQGYVEFFRDENKYLLQKEYWETGMKVTWDFLDMTANVFEHEAARDNIVKTDRERAVVSMGIISQVKLRAFDAMRAIEAYKKNTELKQTGDEAYRLAREIETAKEQGAPRKMMLIAREIALSNVLQVEVDQILSLGEAHAALADLETSVGSNYPIGYGEFKYDKPVFPRPNFNPLKRAAGYLGSILGKGAGVSH